MKIIPFHKLGDLSALAQFQRRKSNGSDDWGDPETATASLKRKGKTFEDLDLEKDFGIYLGNNTVGIIDIERRVIRGERFDSLEEMKAQWELD